MVLDNYKNIINEIVIYKDKEKDPEKKKSWEAFELNTRRLDRTIEIQNRIKLLYKQNRFIECICFISQFAEFKLKELIKLYVDLSLLLNKKIKIGENWQEKPLGTLTNTAKKLLTDDNLMKRLKDFNNLRIKSIHKIFDVNYQIAEVEEEINQYLKTNDYYENIINPIQRYSTIITKEIFDYKTNLEPVPEESKIIVSNLLREMEKIDPLLKNQELKKQIKL
ncbi:hypothetical protein KJ786_00190 [Patescibacteria group bacterium]|nr:hypothetical protein [Patescibacteria group bacterium]